MATLLDERPKPRKPTLFGRALVQQQIANQQAAEKDREQTRLEQQAADTKKHQQIADQIAAARLEIETMKADILAKNELQKVQKEKQQLEAFRAAQTQIGQLNPKDPLLNASIAKIQAQYPVLFEGGGTQYAQVLGGQVKELFAQRKAITDANAKLTEEATKISAAHGGTPIVMKDGVPDVQATAKVAADATAANIEKSGLVPKSAKGPDGIEYGAVKPVTPTQDDHLLQGYVNARTRLKSDDPEFKDKARLLDGLIGETRTRLDTARGTSGMPAHNITTGGTDSSAMAPDATAAPEDPRMALAKAAIEDPAASPEHKDAARKLLGYQPDVSKSADPSVTQ